MARFIWYLTISDHKSKPFSKDNLSNAFTSNATMTLHSSHTLLFPVSMPPGNESFPSHTGNRQHRFPISRFQWRSHSIAYTPQKNDIIPVGPLFSFPRRHPAESVHKSYRERNLETCPPTVVRCQYCTYMGNCVKLRCGAAGASICRVACGCDLETYTRRAPPSRRRCDAPLRMHRKMQATVENVFPYFLCDAISG